MNKILRIIKLWLSSVLCLHAVPMTVTKPSGSSYETVEMSDEQYRQMVEMPDSNGILADELVRALNKDPLRYTYVYDPRKPEELTEITWLIGEKLHINNNFDHTLITDPNGLQFRLHSDKYCHPGSQRFRIDDKWSIRSNYIAFNFEYNGVEIEIIHWLQDDELHEHNLINEINSFVNTCLNSLQQEPECPITDQRQYNQQLVSELHLQIFKCASVMTEHFNGPSHQRLRELFTLEEYLPRLTLRIKSGEVDEDAFVPVELAVSAEWKWDQLQRGVYRIHDSVYCMTYTITIGLNGDIIITE